MDAKELLLSPIAHMPPVQILDGLSSAQAATPVAGSSHTVVEILAHMVHWQSWFLQRCAGMPVPPVSTAALGWPAAGAGDWERTREQFLKGLDRAVEMAQDTTACGNPIHPAIEFPPLANYTVADAITHMAIHNAHHLGQIITLRQILNAWPPPEGSYTW